MPRTRIRRTLAVMASVTLLAGLAVTTAAAPTVAKDVTCAGKVATIVGTNASEVIIGTNRRDVIQARGGNDVVKGKGGGDIICGGSGRDRLKGNRGADKLFGGKGNDPLDGGLGRDLCNQGPGRAGKTSCELPGGGKVVAPTPTPEPTPTPKPAPGDKDGDGYTDDVDACPAQGDQGYGVDATGCPNPVPDSDGDGYTDDVDACPAQGDQGYGVDATGCPNPDPTATFQNACASVPGTYYPDGKYGQDITCEYLVTVGSGTWNDLAVNTFIPACNAAGYPGTGGDFYADPQYIGCSS